MSAISALIKKIVPKRPLYVQILFTICAFLVMVILSYVFTSNIVHKYLEQNMENIFISAQTQIMSDLMEPQITLEGFSRTMRNMIMRGDDADKLRDYYNDISDYLSLGKQGNMSFNGFIGYFETLPDEPVFIESFAWDKPDDFVPAQRQWYLDAIAANGKMAETLMYHDIIYGNAMLIYSLCLFDDEGQRLGAIGLRVQIDAIAKYIVNAARSQGGYGILLSEDLVILAHSNQEFIGKNMHDPVLTFSIFADELQSGIEIYERPLMSYMDEPSVASFRRLSNGWFLGVVTPKGPYYQNVTNMAMLLILLGTALASVLIFVLIRVDAARNKSDEENRHKSSFLANMSHEIRTPMNAIIGMSDILLHEPLNKRQIGFVNDIKVSARSLLSIINDILDLSKIESGKFALNPVSYDFYALLNNIFSMFSYVTQKKGLKFHYEIEDGMPDYLYGDDIRLKQVLTNICGNAVKYTEKGFIKFKVTIADNNLIFEIKDSGMGIRKEDIPKLFSSFQRIETEKNRNIIGTGLGLSISRSFVEMMGGKILVDSEYGNGSVFTVIIPVVFGSKEEVKLKKIAEEGHTLYAPGAGVLVVDDNEFNVRVAQGLFGLFKINVHTAFSGKEAIDMVQKNEYDIVFMDHMMPEMDGVEATAIIRKLGGKYKRLPVIALTANAVQGAREMFLSNGFNGFISKPIDMQEMYGILKEWLPPDKIQDKKTEEKTETADEETNSEFINALNKVSEINAVIGMSRVSGIEDMYLKTLELFTKKALQDCNAMSAAIHKGDIKNFSILVHSMKSALSTIGAMNLSETALSLETASKKDDVEFCARMFPAFKDKLLILHEELSAIFPDAETESRKQIGDTGYLQENIVKALSAASDFDSDAGLKVIDGLLAYDFGAHNNVFLENTAAAFKEFNFSLAAELLTKLKENYGV
jgi:signal transduction histidine kinase/DNA-binding NarL/FixJ family response regulator